MVAHVARMPFQRQFVLCIVRSFDGFEVGVQRRFNVDHEFALVRHAHNHVGANRFFVAGGVHLFLKIAMLDHACQFDQPTQGNFTPAAANFRPPQRVHQIVCFLCQRFLIDLHRFKLGFDTAVGLAAGFLQGSDLCLRLLQRILDRFYEVLDRLFAISQLTLGALLVSTQVLLCQAQEVLAVRLE